MNAYEGENNVNSAGKLLDKLMLSLLVSKVNPSHRADSAIHDYDVDSTHTAGPGNSAFCNR
jgi:hypothetical protein